MTQKQRTRVVLRNPIAKGSGIRRRDRASRVCDFLSDTISILRAAHGKVPVMVAEVSRQVVKATLSLVSAMWVWKPGLNFAFFARLMYTMFCLSLVFSNFSLLSETNAPHAVQTIRMNLEMGHVSFNEQLHLGTYHRNNKGGGGHLAITPWYPKFERSQVSLRASSVHGMTGLGGFVSALKYFVQAPSGKFLRLCLETLLALLK